MLYSLSIWPKRRQQQQEHTQQKWHWCTPCICKRKNNHSLITKKEWTKILKIEVKELIFFLTWGFWDCWTPASHKCCYPADWSQLTKWKQHSEESQTTLERNPGAWGWVYFHQKLSFFEKPNRTQIRCEANRGTTGKKGKRGWREDMGKLFGKECFWKETPMLYLEPWL